MRPPNKHRYRRIVAGLIPALFPVVTILATADCYGPTEITVIVSTDLSCSEGPLTTSFFKGAPGNFDGTSQAETSACQNEPTGAGGTVGTLVMVPSGSSDSEAAVKVIMARPGKLPTACLSDPKDCIIARRAFNFSDHLSRRLPIRLFRECIGVACGEDQTCVAGPQRCVSAKTICEGASCLLPEERSPEPGSETGMRSDGPLIGPDGEILLPDGGPSPDGPIPEEDAGPDPAVTDCTSTTGRLATASMIPAVRNAVASANALFYVKGEAPDKVYTISKTGGPTTIAFTAPGGNGPKVQALAIDPVDNTLVVGYEDLTTRSVRQLSQANPVIVTSNTPILDIAVAPDTNLSRVFVASASAIFRLTFPSGNPFYDTPGGQGASRLIVDSSNVYYLPPAGGGLFHFTRALANNAAVGGAPTNSALGRETGNGALYAAGLKGGMGAIGTINGPTFTGLFTTIVETPQSIGIDPAYFLFHNQTTFYKILRGAMNPRSVIASDATGSGFSHVFYDDAVGGCIYYWLKNTTGTGGVLKVRKKNTL